MVKSISSRRLTITSNLKSWMRLLCYWDYFCVICHKIEFCKKTSSRHGSFIFLVDAMTIKTSIFNNIWFAIIILIYFTIPKGSDQNFRMITNPQMGSAVQCIVQKNCLFVCSAVRHSDERIPKWTWAQRASWECQWSFF